MNNEIILYRPDELAEHIEVRLDNETVWLNRNQIATLFGRDVKTIGKHINNVFSEGELEKKATVANFATVQNEGGRMVERQVEFYNLDIIISVGYRVKSKQGTQFRIWANRVLKDYLLKGYAINNRMNRIEDNVQALTEKVNQIDLQINTHLIPNQGVFFNGQVIKNAAKGRSPKIFVELIPNQGVFFDGQVIKNAAKGRSPKIFIERLNNNLRRGVALKS